MSAILAARTVFQDLNKQNDEEPLGVTSSLASYLIIKHFPKAWYAIFIPLVVWGFAIALAYAPRHFGSVGAWFLYGFMEPMLVAFAPLEYIMYFIIRGFPTQVLACSRI